MKKRIYFIIVYLICYTFSGCNDYEELTDESRDNRNLISNEMQEYNGWDYSQISAVLDSVDDGVNCYYNFIDIDKDGTAEMLLADTYLWIIRQNIDGTYGKELADYKSLGGYASVAFGKPVTEADIYKSDDYTDWYTPNLDLYLYNGKTYISGVHTSASEPYHIGWISEVSLDIEGAAVCAEPLYSWGYTADTALSYDGRIDDKDEASAKAFFENAEIISGFKVDKTN